ncbi:MAG: hypothetical protein IJK92_00975 [Bacteroidales bacterium]|nr:hypothetical protein [Bacteroidales bacterium]
MTLIIDCGSTKAEWVVLDGKNVIKRFITNGFNPNFTDNEIIRRTVEDAKNTIDNQSVSKIFFYGSGCGTETNQNKVAMIFAMVFKINDIEVYPDTLGACHALFGRNPGIACILGTGSNACFFDGEKITQGIVSLGFMLGDEGSGCHIGKRIVHDYFLGIMPRDLREKFDEKYHLDRETLLKNVYHGEAPSRYLAEFARFAMENVGNQYVKDVVQDCFEEFIQYSLMVSANDNEIPRSARNYSVAFVGSVAFVFQDILLEVLENHGFKCTKILKNPMDGLVEYYKGL